MEAALARAMAARWWWALPALDLDLAGRSRPVGGRRLGRRDEADRGRRPNLAGAGTRGSTRATFQLFDAPVLAADVGHLDLWPLLGLGVAEV